MYDESLPYKVVYVGNIGYGCSSRELRTTFSAHGRVHEVWVAQKPPGFAFVEFEDSKDAQVAVHRVNGM